MSVVEESPGSALSASIVVGVDPSDSALRAALWAAREAVDRGLRLELVHALDLRAPAGTAADPRGFANARREDGDLLLDRVVGAVRAHFPQLSVGTALSELAAAESLVELSARAALTVTGTRGHGGFAGLPLGSVSLRLAGHAHGPLVVVRGDQPGPAPSRIVLGVEPDQAQEPIHFAFASASTLGSRLRVVRAWWPGTLYARYGYGVDTTEIESRHADELAGLLKEARAQYPEVEVVSDVLCGNTVPTLIEAARGTRLLVIGAHRRRGPLSLGIGHVVQDLLSHSATPVAVVPIK